MSDTHTVCLIGPPEGETSTALQKLLARYGLAIEFVPSGTPLPGSFWGGNEAGLREKTLWVNCKTPLHSALHEACHFICMSEQRRQHLNTDAGGDDIEECAVCYLSILLADSLPTFGRHRMWLDMDSWGYSFRLGSARRWFNEDAEDARQWLLEHQLIDEMSHPLEQCRQ